MADSDRPDGDELAGKAKDAGKRLTGGLGDKLAGAAGAAGDVASAAGDKLAGATDAAGNKLAGAASGISGAAGSAAAAGAAGLAVTGKGKKGWRSFVPPNSRGRYPWKWRWLGVPLILLACLLTGWWGWGKMESGLNERALAHLACDGIDTSELDLDWSYRSVDVTGTIPAGFTRENIIETIDQGSSNAACLDDAGIDADDNTGVNKVTVPAALAAAVAVAAPEPEPTAVPQPTATPVPEPTATPAPEPTATPEPEPTATPEPVVAALAASAAYDGQTIALTGDVGSEEQRAALVAAAVAAVGEANVIDQLTVIDGDPSDTSSDRIAQLAQAMAAFGGPNVLEGVATASDDSLIYELVAPTDPAAAALDLPGTGLIAVPDTPAPSFTG